MANRSRIGCGSRAQAARAHGSGDRSQGERAGLVWISRRRSERTVDLSGPHCRECADNLFHLAGTSCPYPLTPSMTNRVSAKRTSGSSCIPPTSPCNCADSFMDSTLPRGSGAWPAPTRPTRRSASTRSDPAEPWEPPQPRRFPARESGGRRRLTSREARRTPRRSSGHDPLGAQPTSRASYFHG